MSDLSIPNNKAPQMPLMRVFGKYVGQFVSYPLESFSDSKGNVFANYNMDENLSLVFSWMRHDARRAGFNLRILHPGMDHPVMLKIMGEDKTRVNVRLEHFAGNLYQISPNFFVG